MIDHTDSIRRDILFLEPFYGGSHRDVADGLVAHSRHCIDLVTLPPRFWKWRMRGAALYMWGRVQSVENHQAILISGLMSASDFKALAGSACPPILLYFHETQLTYPVSEQNRADYQYGFTNIASAVSADRVLFNSKTHRDAFFESLPGFLNMMPDCRPGWIVDAIRSKTDVCTPGCHFPAGEYALEPPEEAPPLVVWNHRREHDKDPESFVEALTTVKYRGIRFRLALMGERYRDEPAAFDLARERFAAEIVHDGYVETRDAYVRWLRRGAVVVSTARQENFGISVVEAVRHGCLPLTPKRLSYPEIIPERFHADCCYADHADLVNKLTGMLREFRGMQVLRNQLSAAMAIHAWENRIHAFDDALGRL